MDESRNHAPADTYSTAVVEAVAAREGVEPAELEVPLFDVVDPDALDALFPGDAGTVSFRYLGYNVIVHADGEVDVHDEGEVDVHDEGSP